MDSAEQFAMGSGPLRSIYDRMTNPTPEDLQVGARLAQLGHSDVIRMVDHIRQVMNHLATFRDDVKVTESDTGFTVQVLTETTLGSERNGSTSD